jgi:hypothetical protein
VPAPPGGRGNPTSHRCLSNHLWWSSLSFCFVLRQAGAAPYGAGSPAQLYTHVHVLTCAHAHTHTCAHVRAHTHPYARADIHTPTHAQVHDMLVFVAKSLCDGGKNGTFSPMHMLVLLKPKK